MCGLAAVLLYPQQRSAEDWWAIKEVFTQNLRFNEARGDAATGVVIIQRDGKALVHKLPLAASAFIKTDEYVDLLAEVNAETTLLLGHTRHPTKGDTINNGNNHPLRAGSVFGVHNGHINNDDDLFASCGCPRQAEVDSEIIFRLLESLEPSEKVGSDLASIQKQLQELQGEYTFMACDLRKPQRLLVSRNENPLCLHFHAEWNALVFSSRYLFMRKIFGRSVVYETLPKNHFFLFEADTLPKLGANPVTQLPLGTGSLPTCG